MEKYLGNKSSMLPLIERFLQDRIPGSKSISDVFAGTNNVSRFFRARGWDTAACDANRFSYVLAQAYLGNVLPPQFQAVRTRRPEVIRLQQMENDLSRALSRYGSLYLPGRTSDQVLQELSHLTNVLVRLQVIGDNHDRPGYITEYFTQWGRRSAYASRRGTEGVRNYFSHWNALFLDGVLGTVRNWWRDGRLTRNEVFLLMASIMEEVVITANVNGTFHDFNRDRLWPNAEQAFQLRVPLVVCSGSAAEIANADSIEAARSFGAHDVCYLDPPYNFRQYSAYYHFLNFIAAYPFLDDLDAYLEGLEHVRGQHPDDDFTSDFCFRSKFIESLRTLIDAVDSDHVVLSYYGGRNHWNHWSAVDTPTDQGLHELRALFEDRDLFSACEVVPALEVRKNYQSRLGEQKELVNEYLFHGVKRRHAAPSRRVTPSPLPANVRWNLTGEFGHSLPIREDRFDQVALAAG